MGRSQIFEGIFSAMRGHASLLPLLGTQTATNLRIYRDFPQLQTFLVGPPRYEPATAEGWLVVEETPPGLNASRAQYDSIFEVLDINFHVFATTYGLADDVADVLDDLFSWSIEQQRDVQWGERWLLFTRRLHQQDRYQPEMKLAEKVVVYGMEFVREEAWADA